MVKERSSRLRAPSGGTISSVCRMSLMGSALTIEFFSALPNLAKNA